MPEDRKVNPGELPHQVGKGLKNKLSGEHGVAEPKGGTWTTVVKAAQGNFDHLMGVIRNLVRAHNSLVEDVKEVQAHVEGDISAIASIDQKVQELEETASESGAPTYIVIDGEEGQDGEAGPPGLTGATGATGAGGAAGAAGSPGPPGEDGEDGGDTIYVLPATAAATSGGHTIQDDDANMTARTNLSFQDGFVLTDDAGGDQTEVDLSYGTTAEIADIAAVESAGVSLKVPRADHVHAGVAGGGAEDDGTDSTFPVGFDTAKFYPSATQAISTGTAWTKVTSWDTEAWDGLTTSVTSGDIDIPAANFYIIIAQVAFASNSTGKRGVAIFKNAATHLGSYVAPASDQEATVATAFAAAYLLGSDTIDVEVWQNSGGNLNVQSGEAKTWVALIKVPQRFQAKFMADLTSTIAIGNGATVLDLVDGMVYSPSGRLSIVTAWSVPQGPMGGVDGGAYLALAGVRFTASCTKAALAVQVENVPGTAWGNSSASRVMETNAATDGGTVMGVLRPWSGLIGWSCTNKDGVSKNIAVGTEQETWLFALHLSRRRLMAKFVASATQSIANNTWTTLTKWSNDQRLIDTGAPVSGYAFSSDASGNITVPLTGKYLIWTGVGWTIGGASGLQYGVKIRETTGGGTTVQGMDVLSTQDTKTAVGQQTCAVVSLTAGDTIDVQLFQEDGAPKSTQYSETTAVFLLYLGA